MRFLVTGGAGFIGSALVRELVAQAHDVVIFDDFSRGRRDFVPADARISFVEGDIRDRARVERAVRDHAPERVVHLAALHFIPDCNARPRDTLEINVGGTQNVLDACARQRVARVLYASSAAVYAPSDTACQELSSALGPNDVYGQSKLQGEELARRYHADTGLDVSMLRIFNAIGPRETNPHVLPHVLESLRTSDTIALGNTEAKRDYIDTRDLARAIAVIAEKARGLSVYNVGTGRAHSVADILDLLRLKLGRHLTVAVDPARLRPSDNPLLLADVTKIRAELGWTPSVALEDAVGELIRYYGIRIGPAGA